MEEIVKTENESKKQNLIIFTVFITKILNRENTENKNRK